MFKFQLGGFMLPKIRSQFWKELHWFNHWFGLAWFLLSFFVNVNNLDVFKSFELFSYCISEHLLRLSWD